MNTSEELQRPTVMDSLTETQLKELEFQASEYDEEEFLRIGANYGWDTETARQVWHWFEILHQYPLDGTKTAT